MSFEISTSWLPPASDLQMSETAATMCRLAIELDRKVLTEFRDDAGAKSKHLEIPAYYVAEWIAENWWPLLWEPRKSEDEEPNPDFLSRHSLIAAQHGFALPRLWSVPLGPSVQIFAGARDVQLADVRFLNGARETLSRENVQAELARFVSGVVSRLMSIGSKIPTFRTHGT